MKTTGILIGIMSVFIAENITAGDPEISDVMVRQRWPWSRLVDIEYVLTCDDTQRVDIAVSGYNDSLELTLPAASLSGDLYGVSYGAHRIVWDPTVTTYTNAGVLGKFRVTLTPTLVPLYMAVDLSGGASATSYPVTNYLTEADVPGGVTNDLYKTTHLLLRRVPANTFKMGDPVPPALPTLSVTLTKPFYAGVYEVTQKQWYQVMGDGGALDWPSAWSNTVYRDTRPVENVSYWQIRENPANLDDPAVNWPNNNAVNANSFMGRVRAKTGIDGFDLPTEAQWECLCRAGTQTYFNDGNASANGSGTNEYTNAWLNVLGRYRFNGGMLADGSKPAENCGITNATAAVGSYRPNAWGLYDTHGNVWEWCLDWYTNLATVAVTDPVGGVWGAKRVIRGGAHNNLKGSELRSGYRYPATSNQKGYSSGFRLVRTMP